MELQVASEIIGCKAKLAVLKARGFKLMPNKRREAKPELV
jgi:hypothetical protein